MLPNDKPEAVRAVLPIYCHWVTCRYIDADDSGDTDGRTPFSDVDTQMIQVIHGELERRVDITETSTCIGTQGRVQG